MAYDGYFRYDGVEIVNSARIAAYQERMNLGFFDSHHTCRNLDAALKQRGWSNGGYEKPDSGNTAPWYDPLEPYSNGFAGVHILSVDNIVSTTYSATVQESVSDGGWISRGRYGTRSMLFRALLVGVDMRSVQHGFNWLTTVLRNGDPCKGSLRTRHTYDDFLPLGKKWWTSYRTDSVTARPDNLYQANRYLGLSTTDDPETEPGAVGTGNTYAKLHSGGQDGFDQDALDILVKLSAADPLAASANRCYGNTLEYFVQCPTESTSDNTYRYMTKVELTSGPTVLGEREVGGPDCATGAWLEVEFTLTAANPFAWRAPLGIGLQMPDTRYRDVASHWAYYKSTADLLADDDVFQAPIVAGKAHTYGGFFNTVWGLDGIVQQSPARRSGKGQGWSRALVQDPACAQAPTFPAPPQADFLCRPLDEDGPFAIRRYLAVPSSLPRHSPSAVKITLASIIEEYRDVRLRIIPEGFQESVEYTIEMHILYMPPFSTLVVDGSRKSIDILLSGEPSNPSFRWEPAEHLVVTHGSGANYRFPEIVCGRNFVVEVAIPVGQDPDVLTVAIEAIVRDA